MVVPSLPAKSYEELQMLARALDGVASELQIDIVDGEFVSATSWPYTEKDPISELEKIETFCDSFAIEVDCMIMHPEQHLDLFVESGVRRVVVHMGSTEVYDDIFMHARDNHYQVGLALMNDRPLEELEPFMDRTAFVQLMGIKTIGKQGQPFDARTLDRAKKLRKQYPDLEIAVDGSVNKDTIMALKDAGVTRFAPGSAVAKAADPKAAFLALQAMVS